MYPTRKESWSNLKDLFHLLDILLVPPPPLPPHPTPPHPWPNFIKLLLGVLIIGWFKKSLSIVYVIEKNGKEPLSGTHAVFKSLPLAILYTWVKAEEEDES